MNLKFYLNNKAKDVDSFIEDFNKRDKEQNRGIYMLELTKAFNAGVETMLNVKANPATTTREAAQEIEADLADVYLKNKMDFFKTFFTNTVLENTSNGKLIIGFEDAISDDIENLITTIYNLGFLNGATVAQDPMKLKVYLKNKEKAVDNGAEA